MKKEIMKGAWSIARNAAKEFGGKAIEYIGGALKLAWKSFKKEENSKNFAIVSLKSQSNNNKNRKSWVQRLFSEDSIKVEREMVQDLSDYGAEYKEYKLEDGYYNVCDLGNEQIIRVKNGEIQEIEYAEVKKKLAHNLGIYIEISEGSRNHKSYIAEIVGEHERWGMDRKFVSGNNESKGVKYAHLEDGKVYEIQEDGERKYVHVENEKVKEIAKEEVLKIVAEEKAVKEKRNMEEVIGLLKELKEIIFQLDGRDFPLEDGIKYSKERIAKTSFEEEIRNLKEGVADGRKRLKLKNEE